MTARRRTASWRVAGIVVSAALVPAPALAGRAARLNPIGTWSCLVYARSALGSEHLKLSLTRDGHVLQSRGENGPRVRLSDWHARRGRLLFRDPRAERDYVADLGYPTLGGTWAQASLDGGWWCSESDPALAARAWTLRRSASDIFAAPLVPTVTAAPRYPRQAVREAKEGRAVACFLVNSDGVVTEPELVELSDEVFRKTTLAALARSRYRRWDDARILRPGCRTYVFTLDAVR